MRWKEYSCARLLWRRHFLSRRAKLPGNATHTHTINVNSPRGALPQRFFQFFIVLRAPGAREAVQRLQGSLPSPLDSISGQMVDFRVDSGQIGFFPDPISRPLDLDFGLQASQGAPVHLKPPYWSLMSLHEASSGFMMLDHHDRTRS